MPTNVKSDERANKQIVLKINDLKNVIIKKNVKYGEMNNNSLLFDIFYPVIKSSSDLFPVVIFFSGYSISSMQKMFGTHFKELGQYLSWSKLITSLGFVAITYDAENPDTDFDSLLDYLLKNANSLRINPNKLCFWSCSANCLIGSFKLKKEYESYIKCSIFYYGLFYHNEIKDYILETSKRLGIIIPNNITDDYSSFPNIPTLIVRSGLDKEQTNRSIGLLVDKLISKNIPITFINYSLGHHAFDIQDDVEESRTIIKTTLEFITKNLT